MKKIGLVIAIVGCLAVGNYANGQNTTTAPVPTEKKEKLTPKEKAEKQTNKMKEELGLSDAQAVKVKELNTDHNTEMEKLKAQIKVLKDQTKKLQKEHEAKISSVLTPEQRKLHEEKMAERKSKKKKKTRN